VAFVAAARAVYAAVTDPDDASRGILGCVKLNNAKKPPAIAFRIVDSGVVIGDDSIGRVNWEEQIDTSFEEITVKVADKRGAKAKVAEVNKELRGAAIIRAVLSDGPKSPEYVREALKAAGILSTTTQDRAASRAGVKKSWAAGTGHLWELPPATPVDPGESWDGPVESEA
jgi:hypothetical protein